MKGIHKHKILLIPLSMLAVTLMAGYFLSHIPLGANATTSDVSLHVADTCTMNGVINEGDEHTVSLINGQERTGIGITRLTTLCNDNNGYAIYAIGYSGTTSDPHNTAGELGRTDLIGLTTSLTISTANWADRNTGDNATKSIWSMSLQDNSEVISTMKPTIENGFSNYLAVPTAYTKVASFPAATGATLATASIVNTTYAAKVAAVQSSDTYVGQVKYTMVHPSSNNATGFTFDDAFQLAGKSRVSGTSYFAMQDMNAAICNKVTTPLTTDAASTPQTQLIDIRDNKVYWVAKLMDGKCWMTQNLDLDLDSSVALTSADTDLNSVTSWTPVRSTINASGNTMNTYPTNTGSWATDGTNSWGNDNYTPYSVDAGYKYILPIEKSASGAGESNDQPYDTVYNSLAECQAAASDSSKNSFGLACDGHTSVGNYYNFAAANATNNITSTLTSIGKEDVQNVDLPDSICPAGWRLPKENSDNSKNEFAILLGNNNFNSGYNVYSSFNPSGLNAIRKAPLYFVRSGYVSGGRLNSVGMSSFAWSSTISGATSGYDLLFGSSGINPADSSNRLHGFPVRCVANDSMQSFDQDAAASLAINESLQLRDARDGKEYWVTKLADGNVWMTQNLDLDLSTSTTLTHANTDLGWTNLDTTATWTPVRSTINASGNTMNTYPTNTDSWATDGTNSWTHDDNTPSSVDAGYKYILPIEKTTADGSAWNSTPYDTVYNSLAECQAAASDSSKNSFGLACDGHTSVGNYYNFAAANATNNVTNTLGGSDEVVQNADLPDSICPAGWRLPKANSDNSKNEFAILLGNNNFNSGYNLYSSFNPSGLNAIRKAPLYFVRSGYVYSGTLNDVGVRSNAWSSAISGATSGYSLRFSSSGIGPAYSESRFLGFPVRCLLRTE
ncbi:hypothetical protein IKG68_02875 [Candidatus Saccharibacteria bacterium]|nr:hypothetical protein [Candidatus Saccharibacteria bacterium]